MNTAIAINALVFAVCVGVLWRVFIHTLRQQARFKLFAVRDKFVLLVAQGSIDESSAVFRHYYGRVNTLINETHGLDDILHAAFKKWTDADDFARMLEQADKQAKKLFGDNAFKQRDVCLAVEAYYRAVGQAILAHSSLTRMIYLILVHPRQNEVAERLISHILPSRQSRALRAARYTDSEANVARMRCCAA